MVYVWSHVDELGGIAVSVEDSGAELVNVTLAGRVQIQALEGHETERFTSPRKPVAPGAGVTVTVEVDDFPTY